MPKYLCTLARTFAVTIIAESSQKAAMLAEGFVGYTDDSDEQNRKEYAYEIEELEMVANDTVEVTLIRDDDEEFNDEYDSN